MLLSFAAPVAAKYFRLGYFARTSSYSFEETAFSWSLKLARPQVLSPAVAAKATYPLAVILSMVVVLQSLPS